MSSPPVACGRTVSAQPGPVWIELAPLPTGVALGRRFASSKLGRYRSDDFRDSVEGVVSELVTNAFVALRDAPHRPMGVIKLGVQCADRWAHIHVHDTAQAMPIIREAADDDEHGRGLQIVAAVATLWVEPSDPEPGKTVHALLAAPGIVLDQTDLDRVMGL